MKSLTRSIFPPRPLPLRGVLCRFMSSESSEELHKTAMHDMHVSLGGKMVPFAGYSLPVQYEGLGVLKEHSHTRSPGSASLFDVSHMGQIIWHGKDAVKFLEKVVVADVAALKKGECKLSLVMNEKGGIMDDTVITMCEKHIYMVVNGACKHKDMDHFAKYLNLFDDVVMEYDNTRQLLALQGDGAKTVISRLAPALDLNKMLFMTSINDVAIAGIPGCRITRCGYTGEDGFEISVAEDKATALATALLDAPEVHPAGLGARDSLRLEAGLCLYGNDLNEDITPVEGNLTWTMGGPKSRRRVEQGFLGAEHILKPDGKLKPVSRKRVGISGMKAPAREHTEVYTADGSQKIGEVTSGGFGPTIKKAIAMGYVSTEFAAEGTDIAVSVRGKMLPAQITKMPFVPSNYFKPS